jgi:ABC-type Fe3+/spermidine/putrescine transport system ATPase subunit
MLELEGFSARAGAFHLHDIHLTIAESECHAVLGPSGSGKTTLLKGVLGVLPTLGKILLDGVDISDWPMERRRLGYVPQKLGLFPHLTVRENLRYSARARRIPSTEFEPLLDRLVEITGIGALSQRRPTTLSGGELQRVALVRALAAAPKLVLLDEPFTALNESLRRDLWWLVKSLQRDQGTAVLLITHDLTEANFLADRITVLIEGQQQHSGNKLEVYRRPATEAVARLVGVKNLFPACVTGSGAVDCPALGGGIEIQDGQGFPMATNCVVGIRSEHVALRHPSDPPQVDEVRITGHFIAVLDLGEVALIQFQTGAGTLLEARAGSRVLRRYGLQSGQTGVVGLPNQDLFIVPA